MSNDFTSAGENGLCCENCGKSLKYPDEGVGHVVAVSFNAIVDKNRTPEEKEQDEAFMRHLFGRFYENARRDEGISICHECYIGAMVKEQIDA